MKEARSEIGDFYSLLLTRDSEQILSMFADQPKINTPLEGAIQGAEALREYVLKQSEWLQQHSASVELLSVISTDERVVAEFVLNLRKDSEMIDLPVAIVADLAEQRVTWIRVYHSTWPLTGKHIVREPLLQPAENLEEPEIIEKYMAGLATPDKDAILALFVEEGYLREPSGSKYKHVGRVGLQGFYDVAVRDGGVPLKHCTATYDGQRFAVEYICDEWGKAKFAPQAGMAVYELADSERLLAVRIYDDVSPPSEGAA